MATVSQAHDIKALDRSISDLVSVMKRFGTIEDLEELRHKIIPRPGWTTPAEFLLVQGAINALRNQVEGALALKGVVMDASRRIGQ
jgi:hypothetical protein